MPASTSTSLLTDMYELTMLDAALKDDTAHRRCTFELFGRRLPATRRFGVVAGTGRILEALERFEFDAEQIDWLKDQGIISEEAAQFLASWRFTGDIWGYAEGECYFPGSPLLTVEGTFADCTLLETLLLSILNHDCAVASAASRMTIAAHGRPCMDMGARRAHERAAETAARSCARRAPISMQGRPWAAIVIREAAEATAQSWLRIDRSSVSRRVQSAKVPSTVSRGEPGK